MVKVFVLRLYLVCFFVLYIALYFFLRWDHLYISPEDQDLILARGQKIFIEYKDTVNHIKEQARLVPTYYAKLNEHMAVVKDCWKTLFLSGQLFMISPYSKNCSPFNNLL